MSASNSSDGSSQNQNTPFGGFASATQSSNSNAPPEVPSGFATFPAFGSLNLNGNTSSSNNDSTTQVFTSSNPFTTQSIFDCPPFNSFFSFRGTGAASTSTTTTSSTSFGCGLIFNKKFTYTRPPHPAFKFPSPFTFCQPGFDFSSTPLCCFSNIPFSQTPKLFADTPPFKAPTPTPSSPIHVCKNCGHKSFWGQQWVKVASFYTTTPECDDESNVLCSISAMLIYKDKCHEELRFEDYQSQGKIQTWNAQLNEPTPFGQRMLTLPVLMLPVAMMPTASFHPF